MAISLGKWAWIVAALGVLLLGTLLRVPQLAERPVHGDEANQAVKAGTLYDTGEYRYDAHEHHGPTLYYLTWPALWLSGAQTAADAGIVPYRAVLVAAGLLTLLLILALRDGLSAGATLWAAALVAVSHAFVYYNRYYVQESLLICFSVLTILGGWRFFRAGRLGWAVVCGLGAGLMFATKETAVLLYAAAAIAIAAVWLLQGRPKPAQWPRRWMPGLAVAAVAALAVATLFFTAFFTDPGGIVRAFTAFTTYADRAGGEGSAALHDKPWPYYLQILLYFHREIGPRWTEAPSLLPALIGGGVILWRSRRQGRKPESALQLFLLAFGLVLIAVFSAIPYKTPWNLLPFYLPLLLVAGIGADALVRCCRARALRAIAALLLIGVLAHGAWQSWQGVFRYGADVRNPYVYAHTSTALERLVERVEDLAALSEEEPLIFVAAPGGDYWPLPWYLRDFERVGWFSAPPPAPDRADLVICQTAISHEIGPALAEDYQVQLYSLRPGVLLQLFVRQELWDRYIETRAAPQE